MDSLLANPTFRIYEITALILVLNLAVLWVMSGAVRTKASTAVNEEDAQAFKKALDQADPPAVVRVLRAHANASANIYPFLILALIYVLAGGSPMPATIMFGVFTVARLAHSVTYLAGKQPWRSISFALGGLVSIVLMGFIVSLIVHGAA